MLAREPLLRSRIYRRVAFAPLSDDDVIALMPGYHPILRGRGTRNCCCVGHDTPATLAACGQVPILRPHDLILPA